MLFMKGRRQRRNVVLKDVGGYSTGGRTCDTDSSTYLPTRTFDKVSRLLRLANVVSGDIIANSSFPQLYIDGELVGGLDIVKEMVDKWRI